jgi:hypothetical protein
MRTGIVWRTMLLISIGLAGGIVLTILCIDQSVWWHKKAGALTGSGLFEADPNEIRSFVYTTDAMTLTAQRSKAGLPLAIQVTYADSRTPRHCVSRPDLAGVLSSLSKARVEKRIHQKDLKVAYPQILGRIEVKDAVVGEPIAPWTLFAAKDQATVAVEQDGVAYITNISLAVIKKIEGGCAELGKS